MSYAACALVIVFPVVAHMVGWRTSYLLQVYALIPIWITATLSITVITGYIGQVSAGQAALMGIGAYTTSLLSTSGVPAFPAILTAVAFTSIGALLLGLPTLRLRGPYFVATSLAFGGIFYELSNNWIDLTNGPSGVSNVPSLPLSVTSIGYVHWAVAGCLIVGVGALGMCRLGRSMMAVRDDELAANAIGLHVTSLKLIAFTISGTMAGIAGVMMAHFIGFVSPDFFTADQSLLILTMALLGGVRKAEGALLGSVLMVLVQEVFRQFAQLQLLLYGLAMLVVILFFPSGLVSLFERRSVDGRT